MKYEGNDYKFKKNSINKLIRKYNDTYQYIIINILKDDKYLSKYAKIINNNKSNLLLSTIESTAKELDINNNIIYTYKKINKKIIKHLKKHLKNKKNYTESIKIYLLFKNKNKDVLNELAIHDTKNFLKGLYLYTICED